MLASLLYQIQKLLVISDKLLKLTDFRRKPRWVLPQILRRDLTVNCPYISGRLPTIRWQLAAWLVGAEIKRCCCNGRDVQVAQPWGGHYHPPACKRQVKQSSAVAKIGLSRQNLFNFLAFKLTSWHYEPWSECWFMVRSFRPACPQKAQAWCNSLSILGSTSIGSTSCGSTRQMAGKVLVPQCSGPLPSVGATDCDHHLYKSNAFNRAGRSTTHIVGCIRYIEPKLSYDRSVLKVCVLFKSV